MRFYSWIVGGLLCFGGCTIVEPHREETAIRIFNNSDFLLADLQVAGLDFGNIEKNKVSEFRYVDELYQNPTIHFDGHGFSYRSLVDDYLGDEPLPSGSYTLMIAADDEYEAVYWKLYEGAFLPGGTQPANVEKLHSTRHAFQAVSVDVIDDGGFIIAGNRITNHVVNPTVSESGSSSVRYIEEATMRVTQNEEWLIRANGDGEVLWSRPIDTSCKFDLNKRIAASENGEFLLFASNEDTDQVQVSGVYSHLMYFNASGDLQWQHDVGVGAFHRASGLIVSEQGGYLLSGIQEGNTWLMKVNAGGATEWETVLRSTFYGEAIVEKSEEIIVAGGRFGDVSSQSGSGVSWVGKQGGERAFTALTNTVWSVVPAEDGGVFASGTAGYREAILFRVDAQGNLIWRKVLPGIDRASNMLLVPDGNLVIRTSINNQPALVKVNHDGEILWTHIFPTPDLLYYDETQTLGQTAQGDLIFVATALDAIYLAKLDVNGNLLFEKKIKPSE